MRVGFSFRFGLLRFWGVVPVSFLFLFLLRGAPFYCYSLSYILIMALLMAWEPWVHRILLLVRLVNLPWNIQFILIIVLTLEHY